LTSPSSFQGATLSRVGIFVPIILGSLLPIMTLSANDNMDRLEKARRIGVNAYVIKPFNLPDLLKFLRKFEVNALPSSIMEVL
jgi:CheY-like chemotaxis protein